MTTINTHHLLVQYYRCSTPERQKEIDTCLQKNLENPLITQVHILLEQPCSLDLFPQQQKMKVVLLGKRLTFTEALAYTQKAELSGLLILSNADIYFDETLSRLGEVNWEGVCLALSRHEIRPDGSLELMDRRYAHGSQDVWIFKLPVITKDMELDFMVGGVPGCDNRFAFECVNAGYRVVNPAVAIHACHLDLIREFKERQAYFEELQAHAEENCRKGLLVSPPYLTQIYPVADPDYGHCPEAEPYFMALRELTRLAGENIRLNNQLKDYHQVSAAIALELQKMRQTRSWRLTAPLRALIQKSRIWRR